MVSESIVGAMLGTRLLSNAIPDKGLNGDLIGRTGQVWELLLAGIVTDASLPYFRQFLFREALRCARPAASPRTDTDKVSEVN
jgi:hypothetical protein